MQKKRAELIMIRQLLEWQFLNEISKRNVLAEAPIPNYLFDVAIAKRSIEDKIFDRLKIRYSSSGDGPTQASES